MIKPKSLKSTVITMILLVVIGISAVGCDSSEKIKTIRLAHGLAISHPVHKAMVKMGEDLLKISHEKLKLDIYPNQQLGSERENLELLQIGSLDMTKVSAGVLENFIPKMKILGLPYLFRDKKHSFQVLDGPIGKQLLKEGEKFWLKGLAFYDAGSRSFYTKEKPIHKPEDLEGLKIRVMESVTAIAMVKALGSSPTPISWGELYTSLQQGVVDGAENNPPSFYLSRHYEVCKYYTLDEHTMLPDVLVMGKDFWDRLSAQEQEWVEECVAHSVIYQRKLWAQAEKKALEEVQKAGVEIIRPDKILFEERVESVYDPYNKDPEMKLLIQQIVETQ